MFFHPAPADNDSLLVYAERRGRTKTRLTSDDSSESNLASKNGPLFDLVEIPGCVGKEVSKHKHKQKRKGRGSWAPSNHKFPMGPAVSERDRRDYFTPSSKLFGEFIHDDLVCRYGLDNNGKPWPNAKDVLSEEEEEVPLKDQRITMVKGAVADLTWEGDSERFSLRLECGTRIGAQAIVCAMGPGSTPAVPPYLIQKKASSTGSGPPMSGPGWCHSNALGLQGRALPPKSLLDREKAEKQTTLVVIGGGLTSSQICDVAIRRGISNVVLIMRGFMKVKPFDVGLEWIGRYANLEQMRFWQEDDLEKRREMLLEARNGGSMTPHYAKLMKHYQSNGKLCILDCTTVTGAEWEKFDGPHRELNDGQWSLDLVREQPPTKRGASLTSSSSNLKADYIITATGASPRFSEVPFLATFAQEHGIPEYGGLPALSESLQYGSLPLFCTGAFSALQVRKTLVCRESQE